MTRLAFYDQLTGLANRPSYRIQDHQRHPHHHIGDAVLQAFAHRIGELIRRSDTFARLGGDEFAIILSELSSCADADHFAQKVIASTSDEWIIDGQRCTLGISIGISHYPADEAGSDRLLERADAAMYQAKNSGKNRYVVYQHEAPQLGTLP